MTAAADQRLSSLKTFCTILVLAVVYAVIGKLGLLLALPPGYTSAIFPSAGIAVAAIVCGGARLLPGVALGAFAITLLQGMQNPDAAILPSVAAALIVAIGAMLQAWFGSRLLQRWIHTALDSGRDIMLFLLIAPAMCLVSASMAIAGFAALGLIPAHELLSNWLTWWVGDAIGVLLGAPLSWLVIGRPRRLWQQRRWMLGLPLAIACSAFIAIYVTVSQWEAEQQLQAFRLKAQQASEMLQQQFSEHERILYTLANLYSQRRITSAAEFRDVARSYLNDRPELRSMFWLPLVNSTERSAFERWARQHVDSGYAISEIQTERPSMPAANRLQYYPVTYMEPVEGNAHMFGVDMFSEQRRADAIRRAIERKRPSATEPIYLVHPQGSLAGIWIAQAIHGGSLDEPGKLLGILSATVEIGPYLQRTLAQPDFSDLRARFEDITNGDQPTVLFNAIGHASQPADFQRRLELGGRIYQVTLAPSATYLAAHHGWQSWAVLAGGLLLTGLLGAFLLLMSGQRLRMEHLVQARTRTLQDREARLAAVLEQASDAILTIDRNGTVVSANDAASTLFGHDLTVMHGMPFHQLLQADSAGNTLGMLGYLCQNRSSEKELTGRYADGNSFPMSLAVSLVTAAGETFFVCILRNLTEQRKAQEKIHHLAHHDPLTGLANRFTLNLQLTSLLDEVRQSHGRLALLFIDLDHFKKINDSLGHHIGDQLLVQAGARLQHLLPQARLIARLGNDEFILLFTDDAALDHIDTLAQTIIAKMSEPFAVNEERLQSGASIGIARFPQDGDDADTLLRNADAAVLAAKQQGRGQHQVFNAALNAAAQERLRMENRIWVALERGEFELYLQPQVHLSSRKIIGAEALLRWQHPELGFIAPDRFIPIAEESGLILPLGEWVLERALQILADWQQRRMSPLRLAINLSARQCHSGNMLASLDRLQQVMQVDLQWLEIEITETAAMQDPEQTRELLRQLRRRGIKVAIDDFGTGYSSLSYLKLFEIDRIKIDRSFVKDIENDENDALIASATIALAHTLGLEVLAEGIETEAQCAFLNHELCDEGQGYLFGKAVPLAEFEACLATTDPAARQACPV